MATEKYFCFDEQGELKRIKGRLVRFLDNEAPTGSDKSAIRTSLEVSPDAEGLVQADVGTAPNEIPVNGMLGDLAYQDADSVSVAELEVESTTGTATTQALTVTDGTDTNFVVQEDGRTGINNSSPGTNANSNADDLVVGNGQEHGITIYSGTGSSGRLFFSDGTGTSTYRGYIRYDHGSNSMLWGTNSSQRWAIDSSGNFVSSGGGIDFGSAAAAGRTVESGLLDDYEEGTFTPSLEFGGAATGMTFSNRSGYYTKVGNLVSAQVLIVLSAKGSSTGNATITGLPFTTAGTNGARECSAVYSFSMSGLNSLPMAVTDLSATLATLYESGASGRGNLTDANFTNSSGLVLRLTYEA